jgi:hypothetical protein
MDTITESTSDEGLEADRATLRQSLDQIATDVGTALRESGLSYSVHVRVPNSGDSLATLVTSVDPPDDERDKVIMIFLKIIGDRLGEIGLRSRHRRLHNEWCRRDL